MSPKLVTGLIEGIGIDVDDVKGVALIGQIVQSPFKSVLAASGEVEGDTDFPILYHGLLLFVSLRL